MINKATLIGNLGADPEIRYTPDGTAVANFSVATSDTWKDKQTGEKKSKTEWHRIVAFNKLAEIAQDFLHKGKQVYIEGKIQYRSWETDDGEKKYITEIKAHIIKFLGGRSDRDDVNPYGTTESGKSEYVDDDIPF